ncbi:GNAT family N-acetyltransferase [Pectinatus frisingensis]|uniref:GNAT family N-acetyltransferase n=1 Tax=Pectinatus frisingensis TaxID=865 RepID=UPI003D801BC3
MTNQELLGIAMLQSAIDANCCTEDFCRNENRIVLSTSNPNARKYLTLPFYCNLISYGNNIVASVNEEIADVVKEYINKYPVEHCFETPNIHMLNNELQKKDMLICFMAEYFLPDMNVLIAKSCDYETRVLFPEDFANLYTTEWANALCQKRKHLDVLAVAAYDKDRLIGLAGCSADCKVMWQIGVDVLPEYRRKGIASALTSRLAIEAIHYDKIPFYCAAWSNIRSVRNAIKSGFRPAWIEMTSESIDFVSEINR